MDAHGTEKFSGVQEHSVMTMYTNGPRGTDVRMITLGYRGGGNFDDRRDNFEHEENYQEQEVES